MFWKSKKAKETEFLIQGSISKASIGLERGSEEISVFVDFFIKNSQDELKQKFETALARSDEIRKQFDIEGKVPPQLLREIEDLEQFLVEAENEYSVLSGIDDGEGPWGFSMAHCEMKSLIDLRSRK